MIDLSLPQETVSVRVLCPFDPRHRAHPPCKSGEIWPCPLPWVAAVGGRSSVRWCSSGDISSVSLPRDVRCLQHRTHCWGRIASMPLLPGWSEGLDMRREGLASFGTKGEMHFSQPGRAVQSPFIFPLLCVEDAWPDLPWLHQENPHRGCRRPGTLTSAWGLMKSKRELCRMQNSHLSCLCCPQARYPAPS